MNIFNETNYLNQNFSLEVTIPIPSDSILIKKVHYEELTNQSNINQIHPNEWLKLKDAATYAGVSYNTLMKFREHGLKVAEIEGVKRVSRKEIDSFLEGYSY